MIINEKLIKRLCGDASLSAKASFDITLKPSEFRVFLEDLNTFNYQLDDYIKKLFDCAIRDYEASKILAKNGTYPLAVYHLQQCVEKLTKAYGLFSGYIERDELYYNKSKGKKTIQHISPKTFVLMLQKKQLQRKILIMYKCNGRSVEIDKEVKTFSKLINNPKKLARISKSEINKLLAWFKHVHRSVRIDKRQTLFKARKFNIALTSRIKKYLPNEEMKKLGRVFDKVPDVFLKNMDLPFNFLFLWFLSTITYPHVNWTRYPKENNKQLDPSDYKKGLGIIDSFNDIMNVIDRRLIKRTDNMLKDYKSGEHR